jgi:hypothetical protein
MRRFFRLADIAALVALGLIAAPSVNRAAAQDLAASTADSVVVRDAEGARDAAGPREPASPAVDLRALSTSGGAMEATAQPTSLGASVNGLRSGVHARESATSLRVAAPQRANLGQAQALMVVGGAALIVGAIIGDDPGTIIMVGGAIVGLYGLYQYLQ